MKVWFTIGIPVNGIEKYVPWGEPHVSEDLALLDANIGNRKYKNIKVMEFNVPRSMTAQMLFNKLRQTGVKVN